MPGLDGAAIADVGVFKLAKFLSVFHELAVENYYSNAICCQ